MSLAKSKIGLACEIRADFARGAITADEKSQLLAAIEKATTVAAARKVVDEHLILNKAAILKRAVEKEGLTLAHSIGVGDTESDIPFLEMVAQPICFNPNMNLYRYAKRMKWKVVVERKDVVYEL